MGTPPHRSTSPNTMSWVPGGGEKNGGQGIPKYGGETPELGRDPPKLGNGCWKEKGDPKTGKSQSCKKLSVQQLELKSPEMSSSSSSICHHNCAGAARQSQSCKKQELKLAGAS